MDTLPRPPALGSVVADLPATVPFVGPEAIERRMGKPFRARLGANESGFGPAPSVVAALRAAAPDVWTYGDPENFELRAALAAHLSTPFETVCVGEGIDALLGLTCRLFLEKADRVVTSLGAYPTFNFHVAAQGAELVKIPYESDRESLSGLLDATRRAPTRIVYLANPDNPMGTWWTADEIADFIAGVPPETLIVLDEAYGETAPEGTLPPLSVARPNLLRYRTFSKAYGLAGLRVGYCIGDPRLVAAFDRIRNHFGVNKLAQVAALAALADQDYLRQAVKRIAEGRARLARRVTGLGLTPVPSATNFLAVDCGRDAAHADAILTALGEEGVFVRKPTAPGLDRCIRISIGTPGDMQRAADALARVLARMP